MARARGKAKGGGGGKARGGRSASVSVKDHGYDSLMDRITTAMKGRVTVGIHEEEGDEQHDEESESSSPMTVAEVATLHEFGLGGQERRSFIADWSDENEDENRRRLQKIAKAVVDGKVASVAQGLDRFGVFLVSDVQARIKAGISPDILDETKEKKGSDTPLIDKGTLWQSIRHKVE